MANTNKVKFGLKNVYYSKITVSEGTTSYANPVAIPGAVNLSLEAQGEITKFFADNMVYYQSAQNNGYEGDFEVAMIPDSFRKDILNETEDTNGLLVENSNAETQNFALMFEFAGDQHARRHVLYNCSVTRPSVEGATTEDTKEPQTETLTISAVSTTDGYVKASVDPTATNYENWFTAVQVPDFTP